MKPHIFIHIPKTGGWVLRELNHINSFKHKTALEIREEIGAESFDSRFKFAFVRNPYDRLLSAYCYFHQMNRKHMFWKLKGDRKKAIAIKQYPTFHDFIEGFESFEYRHTIHFQNQSQFIFHNGHCMIDYIGRFENYNDSWHHISWTIGMAPVRLKKKNTSRHREWKHYYDNSMKELVFNWFRSDFELFDYLK